MNEVQSEIIDLLVKYYDIDRKNTYFIILLLN